MVFDFSGWATRNNVKCSDGRVIMKDAFKHNDGQKVPLVWNHQHNDPFNVLGHAVLENREEGVYAYCTFNNTESGQAAKEAVVHGDICAMSIYANQLQQQGSNVVHGAIREVSLVHAGANPEAFIDTVIKHGEVSDNEAIIYMCEALTLRHSDDDKSDNKEEKDASKSSEKKDEETIAEVFDTLTDKQKNAVYAVVGMALEEKPSNDDKINTNNNSTKEDKTMKHNVFDNEETKSDVISHSDQEGIIAMAKSSQVGTFQNALKIYAENNNIEHAATSAASGGFVQTGEGNVTTLFPEYADVRPGAPELITNDQGWISVVMNKVHKSPISRIRTSQVDIRNIDTLRANGHTKGNEKKQAGNFKLVRRTTDPQTVYVKNALHRDDIIDITDFDYVQYLYNIDRMMLNEEMATAIMIGDGREDGDEAKIAPEHIRPIWLDDDLYTIHVALATSKST